MRLKKNMLWILPLLVMVGLFIPKDVFADELGTSVTFTTTILNWKNNNDLKFSCGSVTASNGTVSPKVYFGLNTSSLTQVTNCNFSLSSLNVDAGNSFIIVEEFDFSEYSGSSPEFEEVTVRPGVVSSDTVAYSDDLYMFGEYYGYLEDYSPLTVYLYNMNTVDGEGNITAGGMHVYQAYLEEADTNYKYSELDMGRVSIPSYCIRFNFSVRGNIANTYGTFGVDYQNSDITAYNGDTTTVCSFNGSSLTREQFDDFATDFTNEYVSYTGVNRESDYELSVSSDEPYVEGDGSYYQDITVIAKLESDGSQTGLLYTVVPFVVLIGLVILGTVIIRKRQVKES